MRTLHTVLSPSQLWLAIVGMAVVTFALRIFFIALIGRHEVPPQLRRALRFVPSAVLTALVLPDLLYKSGALDLTVGNHRLIAGLIAAVAAWGTKNVAATIVVGMAALIALNLIR